MFNRLTEEKGFTLVEMLIVIAIIAVLAGIAAPKMISYKQQADANTCISNQASLETAMEQYASTANSYPADALAIKTAGITKREVKCPSGGTYALAADGTVSCSDAKHKRP